MSRLSLVGRRVAHQFGQRAQTRDMVVRSGLQKENQQRNLVYDATKHTINIDRVGEHMDATWKLVKRVADGSCARASMLGVWISEPKQPQSEKPRSSATMTRKLGLFSAIVVLLSFRSNASSLMLVYSKGGREVCGEE